MGAVPSYPRRELGRLRMAWLRRNQRLVLMLFVGTIVLAGLTSLPLLVVPAPGRWYLLGLLHAGLGAAVLHLLHSAFLAHERGAIFQLRGAWGEENTRSELQRARRRRLIWGWVDSITLRVGDLDHVVITRSGGIVVLDSKWRSEVTPDAVADMTASATRTRVRAEALARTLLKADRSGRHRGPGAIKVTPVVVVWGPARLTLPKGHAIGDVHFVDGRDLVGWLRRLDGQQVAREAAADLIQRLEEYRKSALVAAKTTAAR